MLGFLGFSAAALAFFSYGVTASKFKVDTKTFNLMAYENAYYITAVAFVIWAAATVVRLEALSKLVLLGDVALLLAVVALVRVVASPKHRNLYTFLVAILAIAGYIYRLRVTGYKPIIANSVLVFNTPRLFGAFIALTLIALWFPANMKFYDLVIAKTKTFKALRTNYFVTNLVAVISVSGFLFARKKFTIVVSFSLLIFTMLTLLTLNFYVANASHKRVPSHAK